MKKLYIPVLCIFTAISCDSPIFDEGEQVKQITGRYDVDEWSETMEAQSYFEFRIFEDNRGYNRIVIENFYNAGLQVYAEMNGSKILIPVQVVGDYEIEGLGTFNNGELIIEYSVGYIDSMIGLHDICNAICTKK